MNFGMIKTAATKALALAGAKLKLASPELLVIGGIVAVGAAAVVACNATIKADAVLDEHKENLEKIHRAKEVAAEDPEVGYTEEDAKKDIRTTYIKTAGKLIKVYGPAAVLFTLGVISILTGHGILKARHVASVAAFTGLSDSFKEYRARVAKEVGEEKEDMLFRNAEKELISEVIEENGENKTVTRDEKVVKKSKYSSLNDPCTFLFDAANAPHSWSKASGYNLMFLTRVQCDANDKLRRKGFVTLNEVLDALGMERTVDGITLGWVDEPGRESVIDFGFLRYLKDDEDAGCFRSSDPDYMLHFNCDGDVHEILRRRSAQKKAEKLARKAMAKAARAI